VDNKVPYPNIEGSYAETLGKLCAFLEKLFSLANKVRQSRTVGEWTQLLLEYLHAFIDSGADTAREIKLIMEILNETEENSKKANFHGPVPFSVIKYHLSSNLNKDHFSHGYLSSGVTFCSMLPMRAIPFKVICMVGLNDTEYPRQAYHLGFDLMAQNRRRCDRSQRNDDRYIFLEAIASARQTLYLSYIGREIKDNSPRPPSVLVSEILDVLEHCFGSIKKHIFKDHRLQAFNPQYFEEGNPLLSYSAENYSANLAALKPQKAGAFFKNTLSEPDPDFKIIDLKNLYRFFENPCKAVFEKRLGIYLRDKSLSVREKEFFDITGLEEYSIKREIIKAELDKNCEFGEMSNSYRVRGFLPHGNPGDIAFRMLFTKSRDFFKTMSKHGPGNPLVPVTVNLCINNFKISGTLENLFQNCLLHFHPAKLKGKHMLELWISHLILNCLKVNNHTLRSVLVTENKSIVLEPVTNAQDQLKNLLNLYWQGLSVPLVFFPHASYKFAEVVSPYGDKVAPEIIQDALNKAWEAYYGDDAWKKSPTESDDPYFKSVFRYQTPVEDSAFKTTALSIYGPLFDCMKKKKPGKK
jgi:exodeoxyribonuclease V gamma subunit